jgi:hypothetical protein
LHSFCQALTDIGGSWYGWNREKVELLFILFYLLEDFYVFQICGNLAAEVPESSNLDKQLLITSIVSIQYDLPDNSTYSPFSTSIALGQPFIWT